MNKSSSSKEDETIQSVPTQLQEIISVNRFQSDQQSKDSSLDESVPLEPEQAISKVKKENTPLEVDDLVQLSEDQLEILFNEINNGRKDWKDFFQNIPLTYDSNFDVTTTQSPDEGSLQIKIEQPTSLQINNDENTEIYYSPSLDKLFKEILPPSTANNHVTSSNNKSDPNIPSTPKNKLLVDMLSAPLGKVPRNKLLTPINRNIPTFTAVIKNRAKRNLFTSQKQCIQEEMPVLTPQKSTRQLNEADSTKKSISLKNSPTLDEHKAYLKSLQSSTGIPSSNIHKVDTNSKILKKIS